jgi:tetratricopeptide (TPR) repeat protein
VVFVDILKGLGAAPSYNRCLTLGRLGRCCEAHGQPAQAEQLYRQELAELAYLEQSEAVRRQVGAVQIDIADVLTDQGDYSAANAAYTAALEIMKELGDQRNMGVVLGQLGTLALMQGKLAEAAKRLKETLALFRRLNESASEAIAWHNLGIVHQQAEHWEQAEQAYRQAARLREEQGLLVGSNGTVTSWGQLARICEDTGRTAQAEHWYSKALAVHRAADDRPNMAITLNNLASLLVKDPARLDEARRLAEESLAIKEKLDSAALDIWKTCELLARIASQQGNSSQAAAYRAKSRQAYFDFPAWRQQMQQHEELIAVVVQVAARPSLLEQFEPLWDELAGGKWANLKAAIRSLLSGQRDEAALCGPLDYEEAAVIRAILEGIDGVR